MTAEQVIVVIVIALLVALGAGLLLAEHLYRRRRKPTWSPFGPDGRLRSDLFTPTSEGGQGFHRIGT